MESGIFYHMIEQSRREYLIHRVMENSIMQSNGCREWTATKNDGGYGMIHFAMQWGDGHKSSMTASRALYQAHHNIILSRNQWVLHTCDNPSCVNIDHLFLGSPKDNAQDKLAKGRNAKHYRLTTRQCIHSDEKIRAIKNATGMLHDVAEQYGVSISYVSKLRAGKAKTLVV